MEQTETLRRTALILVSIGLLWNLAEAVVAFWAGASARSVLLIAFGADSIIELFAGGVLVWRLTREQGGHDDEEAESRAQRLVGLTFFLLAAYVAVHSVASLVGWLPRPEPSLVGVGIAVASAVVMSVLYVAKMRIAVRMQSRSLRSRGRREPVLRSAGPGGVGRARIQRAADLVVGRPRGVADPDPILHQRGPGELLRRRA